MSKPTKEELQAAMKKAGEMKEHDKDPDFIAKALLNAHFREQYLEKVFHHVERYLKFGQDEQEHQELLKAIEYAREQERRINKEDNPSTFGL